MSVIRPSARILAVTIVAVAPAFGQSLTPDPNKWRPVVYADLQLPGETALPFTSLWADELRRNNDAYRAKGDSRWGVANAPASESHVVIRSPQRTVVLSVLHTITACKPLRTDKTHATLKRCPMRLALYQGGKSTVADAGHGCFIEYGVRVNGAAPDLVRNAALAAYDAENRTIRAGIVFAGEAAEECQFRVPIPPA